MPPDLSQSHLFGMTSEDSGTGKGALSSLCSLLEQFLSNTGGRGWKVFIEIIRTSKSLFEKSFLWSWCFSTSDPSLPNPILLSLGIYSLRRPSISGCQYWLLTGDAVYFHILFCIFGVKLINLILAEWCCNATCQQLSQILTRKLQFSEKFCYHVIPKYVHCLKTDYLQTINGSALFFYLMNVC